MKTIIVATDYSETADNALQFGAHLARVFNADLVLFNAYHLDVHVQNSLIGPDGIDKIIKGNEDRLQGLAAETSQQYGIRVNGVSKTVANTVEELENYLAVNPVDLVVMGIDSNLTEYKLFGNTTTAAIKRLRLPVLVVPNDIVFRGMQRILYACEHTYLEQDNHLDLLKEITRKFQAELQVLHIEIRPGVKVPETVGDQVRTIDAILEDVKHTYRFVEDPDIEGGILRGVEMWQADLLVMVPHKAGFWELLLNGSTTRELTLRARVPLLILPNNG
jgi:nucleotide-binding universal stress UspA family protein